MLSFLQAGAALLCGGVFSSGLLISGMADPAKVTAFLDLFGAWDATLAFVMAGAIAVAMPFFRRAVTSQQYTIERRPIKLPENSKISSSLILGSALFGIGWGLSGVCPAPALVLVGSATEKSLVFAGAMLLGVLVQGAIKL